MAANLTLAGLLTLALTIRGLPPGGSLAAGAAVAGSGIAFAGIAAVAAQISPSARTCNALVGGSVAVAFLLRGIGDVTGTIDPGGSR